MRVAQALLRQGVVMPNNSMQRTALRAGADAERSAFLAGHPHADHVQHDLA
jgi:hypothetical protein